MAKYIRRNVGTPDRLSRIAAAVIILTAYNLELISGTIGLVFGLLGAVLLATGFIGLCPVYYPFGINTRRSTG